MSLKNRQPGNQRNNEPTKQSRTEYQWISEPLTQGTTQSTNESIQIQNMKTINQLIHKCQWSLNHWFIGARKQWINANFSGTNKRLTIHAEWHFSILCCQRKWLSSTVLFQQGFHMRNYTTDRRKFRSQTSDNMDRWKAEQGRGREKRKIRREKSRRERVRRKKMQMREKVGKSRNTVFFTDLWLRRVEK